MEIILSQEKIMDLTLEVALKPSQITSWFSQTAQERQWAID